MTIPRYSNVNGGGYDSRLRNHKGSVIFETSSEIKNINGGGGLRTP